jgi:methylated-DNA-[protein]-cysteine S-methyltransferase
VGQRPNFRGQRASRAQTENPSQQPIEASIFPTSIGWIGAAGSGTTVAALTMGHASAEEVRAALESSFAGGVSIEVGDWYPELRRALERYAQGRYVDLRPFKIDLGPTTPYRRQVLETARRIPYGKTMSYGELAAKAGKPRAARAVGSAMASNRIALLIPCHRVVAAGGAIGGFSFRTGVELKQRLLELEASALSGKSRGRAAGRPL